MRRLHISVSGLFGNSNTESFKVIVQTDVEISKAKLQNDYFYLITSHLIYMTGHKSVH